MTRGEARGERWTDGLMDKRALGRRRNHKQRGRRWQKLATCKVLPNLTVATLGALNLNTRLVSCLVNERLE